MNAKQQRKNRFHLADMLENRVTDKQFDMRDYTNHCGTAGCALGIAVLSGEFGYGARPADDGSTVWDVVKEGKVVLWHEVGLDLFGGRALLDVFLDYAKRPRQTVAAELRAIK